MAEELERDQAEARDILQRLAWQPHDKGNIALLNGDWPGQNRAVIDALAAALRQAGYQPTLLDAPAFLNPFVVSPERFDLLIITGGRELPIETAPTLARFLKNQGNLIALGTPLYADPLRRVQDGWMKPADIRAKLDAVQPARVLYDFESDSPAGWTRSSNKPDNPVTFTCASEGAGGSQKSMHVTINDLTGWETFAAPPLPENAVDPTQNVLCFWAKRGERTKRLAIECSERDGSRWIATVPLQREWTQHALVAADFAYWQDSPTGNRRGGPDDRLQFAATARITVGLAFTHTGTEGGRHEFWIDQLGFAQSPLADVAATNRVEFPPTELLWPSYKCYRTSDCPAHPAPRDAGPDRNARPAPTQGIVVSPPASPRHGLQQEPPLANGHRHRGRRRPRRLPRPRPDVDAPAGTRPAGPGLGDARVGRSGVSHRTAGGQRRRRAGRTNAPGSLPVRRRQRVLHGLPGRTDPTGRQGRQHPPTQSGRGRSADPRPRLRRRSVHSQRSAPRPGAARPRSSSKPAGAPTGSQPQGYRVVVELVRDQRVIDRLQHDLSVWRPKDRPEYVTARDGDFYLQGQKWYPYGVNHMPASGIGTEDYLFFEHYLSRRAYDPEIFDRELARIKALGMNMISTFIGYDYHADRNLFDYLQRCDKYGLKVNLSLRPGTPMDFEWDKMREMIVQNRLAQSDTVFAYDLAWEPFLGRQRERTRWDQRWSQWIQRHYVHDRSGGKGLGLRRAAQPRGPRDQSARRPLRIRRAVGQDGRRLPPLPR